MGVTFVTNWLALIPWRRSRDKHWTEQARLLYPALVAARSDLLSVPAILTLAVLLCWPDSSPLWVIVGVAAMIGAYAGTLFFDHEVFPRIPVPDLLRQIAIGWLMVFLIWVVFFGAAVFMPHEFNATAWTIGGIVVLLLVLWNKGGWIWLGRRLGLFQPAPERLVRIVSDTSSRMNISYREVLLMRSPHCQALAAPGIGLLLFTDRLLEVLPDDEIAAICAHELAHLTESKWVQYSRFIRMLTYTPWIFFTPSIHAFGIFAFYGLLATTLIVPRIYGKISRKMEVRADSMAKTQEADQGTYARALARLYQDNLIPAVTGSKKNPDASRSL